MKKLLFTLALFALVATSRAVDITYIQTNDYIGNSRDTINDNFSNMLASVHASASNSVVVTFTQMSSNWFYWVSNSVDGGISYWLGCNTNGSGGAADGNTPQGPWTNVVNFNGFSGSGGNFIQLTNQTAIRIGTNLLAVQGWPDATNIAWNGAALINVSGGGGGGAYAYQGTNNIAPTNGLNSIDDATTQDASIGGGVSNRIVDTSSGSRIDGGLWNSIANGALRSIIGGGISNSVSTADDAGVFSGEGNIVSGSGSAILGGLRSSIVGSHSVIGGGEYNTNASSGSWGVIGGGHQNFNDAGASVIGGGWLNRILDGPSTADACVIAGGEENVISGTEGAAIGGGWLNNIGAGSQFATIIGGVYGDIGSAATYSTVLGGLNNDVANSVSYAVVAGRRAKANHSGTFVWADSTDADFASTAADTFNIRASSGVYVKSGTMGAAVRQPLYLGAYTNANPTTIKPTMQMDWYYDAGSNYILRTTDGTTNGWAHLP